MDKKLLRKEMMNKRNSILEEEKKERDICILNKLLKTSEYKNSKVIFIYIGYSSEINTSNFIKKFLKDNKVVCVPRTNYEGKYMEAVVINSLENLSKDKYGILEPDKDLNPIDIDNIDLVILPGLAFDNKGGRLGYGGGYYDKYLSNMSDDVVKIALCYDFQVVDNVPMEEHDICADLLITDR